MKWTPLHWTALLLLSLGTSAQAMDETAIGETAMGATAADRSAAADTSHALPAEVSQALAAPDCERLSALNQMYWALPPAPDRELATAALERAILAIPRCGAITAELVRVEPVQGVNPFDFRAPLGVADQGR